MTGAYIGMVQCWFTSYVVQELCESRGGRPGLSSYAGRKDLLNSASALVTSCP